MPAAHGHFGKGLIICRGIVAFVRLFQFKKEFKTQNISEGFEKKMKQDLTKG